VSTHETGSLKSIPEAPAIGDNEIIIDALETSLGWMSFALSNNGLLASTLMFETETEALTTLKSGKILGNYQLIESTEAFQPTLLEAWKHLFSGFFTGNGDEEPGVDSTVDLRSIPIDDTGWSPFNKKVYRFLLQVPAGEMMTYGEVAAAVGSPGAARAVGSAMKNNPIPPLVPCHRVVGSNGKLVGYSAAGGLKLKQSLLKIEGIVDIHI
jgi:O-6-methylguanine DNA methyltransferase